MPPIRIQGLTKTCRDGPLAVDHVVVGIDAPRLRAEAVRDALDAAPGADVLLADEDRATLAAVVGPRTRLARGATVELAIDPARLHAFDPSTGAALARDGAPATEHALA